MLTVASVNIQIQWEAREQTDFGSCCLDSTVCLIGTPDPTEQHRYYSVKHADHCLKYTIAVHPKTGLIVWISKAYPGSVPDITIARQDFLPLLRQGERVFADKGYRGEEAFITPFVGPEENLSEEEKEWNRLHTKLHWTHMERINGRLKVWKWLEHRGRYNHEKHERGVHAIARIVNIDLLVHPLWQ